MRARTEPGWERVPSRCCGGVAEPRDVGSRSLPRDRLMASRSIRPRARGLVTAAIFRSSDSAVLRTSASRRRRVHARHPPQLPSCLKPTKYKGIRLAILDHHTREIYRPRPHHARQLCQQPHTGKSESAFQGRFRAYSTEFTVDNSYGVVASF